MFFQVLNVPTCGHDYCRRGWRLLPVNPRDPTLVYSILLNIATKLELRKATRAVKLELLEATLVTLESYKRRCTVPYSTVFTPVKVSEVSLTGAMVTTSLLLYQL